MSNINQIGTQKPVSTNANQGVENSQTNARTQNSNLELVVPVKAMTQERVSQLTVENAHSWFHLLSDKDRAPKLDLTYDTMDIQGFCAQNRKPLDMAAEVKKIADALIGGKEVVLVIGRGNYGEDSANINGHKGLTVLGDKLGSHFKTDAPRDEACLWMDFGRKAHLDALKTELLKHGSPEVFTKIIFDWCTLPFVEGFSFMYEQDSVVSRLVDFLKPGGSIVLSPWVHYERGNIPEGQENGAVEGIRYAFNKAMLIHNDSLIIDDSRYKFPRLKDDAAEERFVRGKLARLIHEKITLQRLLDTVRYGRVHPRYFVPIDGPMANLGKLMQQLEDLLRTQKLSYEQLAKHKALQQFFKGGLDGHEGISIELESGFPLKHRVMDWEEWTDVPCITVKKAKKDQ